MPTSRARAGASRVLTTASLGRARAALVVLLLCAAGVLGGSATPAAACDCADLPVPAAYAGADVVFTGTLVSRTVPEEIASSEDPATWLFAVDQALKGRVPERASVLSAVSGASCGLELEGTGPFVVFARDSGTHLTAGLCEGTTEFTPAVERELSALADGSGAIAPAVPEVDDPAMGTATASESPLPLYLAGGLGLLLLVPLAWRYLRRG